MHYKTITLELIQEQPDLYERLRSTKRLLPAMDAYANELKADHEARKEAIFRRRPGSDPTQAAAEALELAIRDLQDRLHSVSSTDEAESIPTDAAMNGLPRRTPPG
ncbi:MAG: hypothetical protein LC118_14295 [Dehalococcoidia bacterium]|nr:hypothetical protein [Dehalococcoidia bacterium]